jgi:hypothetical protein
MLSASAAGGDAPARPEQLVFAMPESSYASLQGAWVEAIYREAFANLGIKVMILPLPTKRASVLLASGEVDGDVHRSLAYGLEHPELVRVEQPHFAVRFAAYSKLPKLYVNQGWDSFIGTTWRVDYILGAVTSGKELPKRVPPERLAALKSVAQGLRKLDLGRSDVLVALDMSVDPMLDSPEFRLAGIHKAGVLEKVDGYLYLQKKHAWLAPVVAQVLVRMKRDGRIDHLDERAREEAKAVPESRGQPN